MFSRPRQSTQVISGAAIVCLLAMALGAGAIGVNALGAGDRFDSVLARVDRFLAGPPPKRDTVATVIVDDPAAEDDVEEDDEEPAEGEPSPEATTEPTLTPTASATPSLEPGASAAPTAEPTPEPTPAPRRKRVDVDILKNPQKVFNSQAHKDWCAPAGVQMTLAALGLVKTTDAVQREIHGKVRKWESYDDSHNGDWGPAAMVLALDAYGAQGYEIHAYKTRQSALRGAARAIEATGAPAILLAWRGAHTWVMTGFRADADPKVFKDAKITGAYILDPWYPRVSNIWGRSDPPGTFQDASEMERNFLKWRRPEGRYPERDGKYIVVIPTEKVS